MYQYLEFFEAQGHKVTISPLFGDNYLRELYDGRRDTAEIVRGYCRRIARQIRGNASFDLVWLEKELLPWMPAWTERLRGRPPIVVDYDDAVFHRYDQHRLPLVRRVLGRRIDHVMARSAMVTAGNGYLSARARAAGCLHVEDVPTVVDLRRYSLNERGAEGGRPLRIGWIGSPVTAGYLHRTTPAIMQLSREYSIEAIAIGAHEHQVAGTPFRAAPWTEASEAGHVASFDIGIMPLPDEAWERGKCGYKLIQYMACGIPVVASPVGVNKEIVTPGQSGLLASDESEWLASLRQLAGDALTRRRMGLAGRARVEQWYSLQAQAPRLQAMFEDVARRGR